MGGKAVLSMGSRTLRGSITSVLASALLEWMLIGMLLVNALFGYLISKFARYCDLPNPCLLCSRIDNILGKEKAGFYWDIICGNHKREISSLVYCHFHEKLVDVRGVCESCLFSFATKDKSNAETYRLLVGKLGEEDLSGSDEDALIDDHMNTSSKHCCCCNKPWTPRRTQTLLQTESVDMDVASRDYPLSRKLSQHHDSLEKETIQPHPSGAVTQSRVKRKDKVVQFGYTELKISSDSESDIEASDYEDSGTLISDDPLRDLILDSAEVKPFISVSDDDSASIETVDVEDSLQEPLPEFSELMPSESVQSHGSSSSPSTTSIGHGLEELNWQNIDLKPNESASTERVNDISLAPSSALPTETTNISPLPDTVNAGSIFPHLPKHELDTNEAGVMSTSVNDTNKDIDLENLKTTTTLKASEIKSEHSDGGLKMLNSLDLSDAYKVAISSRARQLSEKSSEQLAGKDSSSSNADLTLKLSQLSRGLNLPSTGVLSPRVSRNFEELKSKLSIERSDSRKSIDRNESGVESLDFTTVTEIEGESDLARLKRQLEHDRLFMIALLKELDEERNASAISANETMAMITRLQEEKAALQMEASHGLRMMEEQAEYDMDALDKLNDLVTEKDKEIQDLEAELEYFRGKYPNEFLDGIGESGSDASQDEKQRRDPNDSDVVAEKDSSHSKDSCSEVADDREYLSDCLKKLNEKLSILCQNSTSGVIDEDQLEKQAENLPFPELREDGVELKSEINDNVVVQPNDSLMPTESHLNSVVQTNSVQKSESAGIHKEADMSSESAGIHKEADMSSTVDEASSLSEKLQAIEADRAFIEQVKSVLENGEKEQIHEIASHLRELRKIGIRRYRSCFEEANTPLQR